MKLKHLERLVRKQLELEYPDAERQEAEFWALTVPRLLEMLSYMNEENYETTTN